MRLLLLIFFASLLGWQATARAACELRERAEVPFTLTSGHLLVPLTVNGGTANFVLDTGAERSDQVRDVHAGFVDAAGLRGPAVLLESVREVRHPGPGWSKCSDPV